MCGTHPRCTCGCLSRYQRFSGRWPGRTPVGGYRADSLSTTGSGEESVPTGTSAPASSAPIEFGGVQVRPPNSRPSRSGWCRHASFSTSRTRMPTHQRAAGPPPADHRTPAHVALTSEQTLAPPRAGGSRIWSRPPRTGSYPPRRRCTTTRIDTPCSGHIARNNPHWQAAGKGESLAIIPGIDACISPGHHASKAEHGRVVLTWNHVVLHVHGAFTAYNDADWLRPTWAL